MLIHSVIPRSSVNGPGERTTVWVQGCTLNCAGCFNSNTHAFARTARVYTPLEMASMILGYGTPGVTFSGGEPLHQAAQLANLLMWLKHINPNISLGMFTGYSRREAERGAYYHPCDVSNVKQGGQWNRAINAGFWSRIAGFLDFAVMGRYNQDMPCDLPLRSSQNQTLELFSGRYTEADFEPQAVEFDVSSDFIQITGFPKEVTNYAIA